MRRKKASKITLDQYNVFRKRRTRSNPTISFHIDDFSCEGEAVVRGYTRSFGDWLNSLILEPNGGIPKGYRSYVFGISKLESLASNSYTLNSMREVIGND
jgi:hypothetical protein